ncbi:MAG: SIMPL domain-containing protein [Armatimonadota bacterium]
MNERTIEVVANVEGMVPLGAPEGTLLVTAIERATARGLVVAEAIGAALGPVVSVRESGDRRISAGPYPLSLEPVRADGFGGTSVGTTSTPSEARVSLSVNVVFRLV